MEAAVLSVVRATNELPEAARADVLERLSRTRDGEFTAAPSGLHEPLRQLSGDVPGACVMRTNNAKARRPSR